MGFTQAYQTDAMDDDVHRIVTPADADILPPAHDEASRLDLNMARIHADDLDPDVASPRKPSATAGRSRLPARTAAGFSAGTLMAVSAAAMIVAQSAQVEQQPLGPKGRTTTLVQNEQTRPALRRLAFTAPPVRTESTSTPAITRSSQTGPTLLTEPFALRLTIAPTFVAAGRLSALTDRPAENVRVATQELQQVGASQTVAALPVRNPRFGRVAQGVATHRLTSGALPAGTVIVPPAPRLRVTYDRHPARFALGRGSDSGDTPAVRPLARGLSSSPTNTGTVPKWAADAFRPD